MPASLKLKRSEIKIQALWAMRSKDEVTRFAGKQVMNGLYANIPKKEIIQSRYYQRVEECWEQ